MNNHTDERETCQACLNSRSSLICDKCGHKVTGEIDRNGIITCDKCGATVWIGVALYND
jgi:ribosomal protein L37AE/L43A